MDNISYDDFTKLDLRVGKILNAEAVPKSKKLLKLDVDFGTELGSRVILAGIAQNFDPSTLVGVEVVAVLNLSPREMFGIMSHGMLLAAHGADNKLALVTCAVGTPGAKVG